MMGCRVNASIFTNFKSNTWIDWFTNRNCLIESNESISNELWTGFIFLFYSTRDFNKLVKWVCFTCKVCYWLQIYSDTAQGRILHGNSPVEFIERFTEIIGRPPELPKWIISGAVVGMQGGTKAVRHVWDQLQEHNVPVSAFWLQVTNL